VGLDIGIGGGPRVMRLSFIVGETGVVISRLICPGLLDGRGGAVPIMGGPSLLCGRAASCSDTRLAGKDISSSESSPGLNGLSIRCGGGASRRVRLNVTALYILDLRSEGEDGASGAVWSRGGKTGTALASRGGCGGTARSVFSC
jgi:hypothetical protein